MRKKLTILLLVVLSSLSLIVAGCNLSPILEFSGSYQDITAYQGDEISVPNVQYTEGAALSVAVADPAGAVVQVEDNKFIASKAGDYIIKYTISLKSKTAEMQIKVIVLELPEIADIQDVTAYQGDEVVLPAGSYNEGATLEVSVTAPDGSAVAVAEGKFVAENLGTYAVKYVVTLNGKTAEESFNVTVLELPEIADIEDIAAYVGDEITLPTVSFNEGATLEVSVTAPDGSDVVVTEGKFVAENEGTYTIKYAATLNGKTAEEIVNVVVDTLEMGETINLDKAIDVDLSAEGDTYSINLGEAFNAENVRSAELVLVKNGVLSAKVGDTLPLVVAGIEGTNLLVAKAEAISVPAGIYTAKIQAVENKKLNTYVFELHLITKIVKTAEEFAALSLGEGDALGEYGRTERAQGYFVLGANITCLADSVFRTINGDLAFSGIFDGRGYNIDGFTTGPINGRSGLFANVYGGIVRNVSFTNAVKDFGTGGLIAIRVSGYATDGYNSTSVDWYAEFTNILVSGKFKDGLDSSRYVSMFAEYLEKGGAVPKYSVKFNNIVINM
ncbi:MAG: hypothetical protein IKT32_05855, partial [Clostridia bacterium]|nr:hypothetical protein [Clostridia bacterium]